MIITSTGPFCRALTTMIVSVAVIGLVAAPSQAGAERVPAVMWDGGPSGVGTDWHDARNWDGDVIPAPGDHAMITDEFRPITITSDRTVHIARLTSAASIRLESNFPFTIDQSSRIENDLRVGAGVTLTVAGDLAVEGDLRWTGGVMQGAGTTTAEDGLILSGRAPKYLRGRTLVNPSVARWSGGDLYTSAALIENRAGATLEISGSPSLAATGPIATSTFRNQGLVRKTGGETLFASWNRFVNDGSVVVRSGQLTINESSSTGSFDVRAPGVLELTGSTHELAPESALTGPGRVDLRASSATVRGTYDVGTTQIEPGVAHLEAATARTGSLVLAGGTLRGAGDLRVSGRTNWAAGDLGGPGSVIALGGLSIETGAGKAVRGGTLENAGLARWTGSTIYLSNDGAIVNRQGARFEVSGGATLAVTGPVLSGRFDNAGTLRNLSGTTTVANRISFTNRGTVDVRAGRLDVRDAYQQLGGTTRLAAGTEVTTGDYTQTAGSRLETELAGLSMFGRLHVARVAGFDGTLAVDLADGFEPSVGDRFDLIRFGTRSGDFAAVDVPQLDDVRLELEHGPTGSTLVARSVR